MSTNIIAHPRERAFVAFRFAWFAEGFAEGDDVHVKIVHEVGGTDFGHSVLDFLGGGFVREPSESGEDAFDVRIHRKIGRAGLKKQENRGGLFGYAVALDEPRKGLLVGDFEEEVRRICAGAFVDGVEEGFYSRGALVHHAGGLDGVGDFFERGFGDRFPVGEFRAKAGVGAVAVDIGSILRHEPRDEMAGGSSTAGLFFGCAEFIEKKGVGFNDVIDRENAHTSSLTKYFPSPSTRISPSGAIIFPIAV